MYIVNELGGNDRIIKSSIIVLLLLSVCLCVTDVGTAITNLQDAVDKNCNITCV